MHSQVIHTALAVPKISTVQLGQLRHLVPLGLVGLVSWSVWLMRFTLSRVYRPVPPGFTATTSVVVPVLREDPDILDRGLRSWLAENPTRGHRRSRRRGRRGHPPAAARAAIGPAAAVVPFRHRRQAVSARRRHPPGQRGNAGALRLGHAVGAGAARGGSGAVRGPEGRRRRHPAERLPAEDQRVAAGRRLDDRRPVPRLRTGRSPAPGQSPAFPAGPSAYRRSGRAAGAGAPGGRVLPRHGAALPATTGG